MRRATLLGAACLLLLSACAGEEADAPAAGHYRLDQQHYARRLVAERLEASAAPTPKQRRVIQDACIEQAKVTALSLELRADGAFLAQYASGKAKQRLAGSWEQAGSVVTFTTTQAPGGRVTTVPPVRAKRTAEGLLFGGDLSGWAVPHEFLLRRVE